MAKINTQSMDPARQRQFYPSLPPRTNAWAKPTPSEQQTRPISSLENANMDDFTELLDNLRQINDLCNIQDMLEKSRKLLSKLQTAQNEKEKFQAFLEILSETK